MTESGAPAAAAKSDRGPVRRLYDLALRIAGTRHALWALAGLCFLQSICLPVPPDCCSSRWCWRSGPRPGSSPASPRCLRSRRPRRLRHRLLPLRRAGRAPAGAVGPRCEDRDLRVLQGHVGRLDRRRRGADAAPLQAGGHRQRRRPPRCRRVHPGVARRQGHALLRGGGAALVSRPQGPEDDRASPRRDAPDGLALITIATIVLVPLLT